MAPEEETNTFSPATLLGVPPIFLSSLITFSHPLTSFFWRLLLGILGSRGFLGFFFFLSFGVSASDKSSSGSSSFSTYTWQSHSQRKDQ
jgi:hypothetical protein